MTAAPPPYAPARAELLVEHRALHGPASGTPRWSLPVWSTPLL